MDLFFITKEGIVNIVRARTPALITVISIGLSLTLIGVFALVAKNVGGLFIGFYKQIEVEAFLDPSLQQSQREQIADRIRENQGVDAVKYISPEDALKEFEEKFGEDLDRVLTENPLPPSLRIVLHPSFSNPSQVDQLVNKISQISGIEEVIYQKEIVKFIHKYFSLAVIIAGLLIVLAIAIITILIINTIRLTIHARRNIIQIMKLVGATNLFIKSPFVVEGILQGLLGGLIAVGLLKIVFTVIRDVFFSELILLHNLYLYVIIMGIVLGLIGSYVSVNKYLRY
jgi:cell division transport system permease protein